MTCLKGRQHRQLLNSKSKYISKVVILNDLMLVLGAVAWAMIMLLQFLSVMSFLYLILPFQENTKESYSNKEHTDILDFLITRYPRTYQIKKNGYTVLTVQSPDTLTVADGPQ